MKEKEVIEDRENNKEDLKMKVYGSKIDGNILF
jgi:hypothetical protein